MTQLTLFLALYKNFNKIKKDTIMQYIHVHMYNEIILLNSHLTSRFINTKNRLEAIVLTVLNWFTNRLSLSNIRVKEKGEKKLNDISSK